MFCDFGWEAIDWLSIGFQTCGIWLKKGDFAYETLENRAFFER